MKKTNKYIDETKKALHFKSDSQLSIFLQGGRGLVNNWRKERNSPDDYACFMMADILGIDERKVTADIKAEFEKNETKKDFWLTKSRELGSSTPLFLNKILKFSFLFSILCKIAPNIENNHVHVEMT